MLNKEIPSLSVIIPVYFGGKTIGKLLPVLIETLQNEIRNFEVLMVNDGSTDDSDTVCRELVNHYGNNISGVVRYVELARNFSEHNAVMAGLNYCRGEYAVMIDDDFQNPPSEIIKMYREIREKSLDVVYSRYAEKKHSLFRNLGSAFNDRVATFILKKPAGLYLSSFKILHRRVINEVIKYTGPMPYVDGLILRSTQHIGTILVEHNAREEGKSNYTLRKLISLWSNMFINYSIEPLRVALYLGFAFSIVGFGLATWYLIERLSNPSLPVGWATLMICLLLFSGIQLIIAGLIGEFVGRLYLTETGQPQYVVRDVVEGTRRAIVGASNV